MKPRFYEIFRNKVLLEVEITKVENESNLEKIIKKSPKVTNTLIKLLTTQEKKNEKSINQLREVVSDIKCIAYKPTTFRVVIPNGNFFDLKYKRSNRPRGFLKNNIVNTNQDEVSFGCFDPFSLSKRVVK